jgi:molybdopterin/thiamine biosynthesis adenylyltransferase
VKYVRLFSYTCSGSFGPICAFYGGIVSQEVFKAITGKYTPIHQYFLADFSEVVEVPPEDEEGWNKFMEGRKSTTDRREGIRRVIGEELLNKLENAKVFMVGSGAIGCELLKNFAMLEIGAGEKGSVVVTDPDHI